MQIPYNYSPRGYQMAFFDAMDSGRKRACLVWHRKSGKTMSLFNFAIKKAFERVGTYFHCFPEYAQGRKVLWEGMDNEGHRYVENHLDEVMVRGKNKNEMKLELSNGSIWQIIGADNYDSLVGPNPVGLILDEWAVSTRYPTAWDYFRPILAQNGGWAVFVYTPRGRNHGWDLHTMALTNPEWFYQLLTVDDTRAVTREAIDSERKAGMPESMIQQEFYCSFLASTENILIPFEFINNALHRPATHLRSPRLAGADCARYGDDRSALVVRQGFQIGHVETWKNLSNTQLAGKLIDRYLTGFYDAVAIDTIGMPGVFDMVHDSDVPCIGVNVAENSPLHEERFYRLRDELWWRGREFFESNNAVISQTIPEELRRAFIADIQNVHYKYKEFSGEILVESKDKMKETLGFSPDIGDAFIHSFMPGLEAKARYGKMSTVEKTSDFNPLTYGLRM